MDRFDAVGIVEGWIETDNMSKSIEAWQYLIDTGLVWELPGWFGRRATALIESGVCKAPEEKNVDNQQQAG